MKEYFKSTRTATYGILAAIPLILACEGIMIISGSNVHVSSGVLIKQILSAIAYHTGAYGHLIILIVFLIAAVIIYQRDKKDNLKLKAGYFAGMLGESLLYAPLFAVTVGWMTMKVMQPALAVPLADGTPDNSLLVKIGLSLGAGIYEELIFRVLLFGGLFLLIKRIKDNPAMAAAIAAVISSLIFSGIHYIGPLGYEFTWTSFLFRAIAGLVLTLLYVARGFGIAAWTHALYDVMVFSQQHFAGR